MAATLLPNTFRTFRRTRPEALVEGRCSVFPLQLRPLRAAPVSGAPRHAIRRHRGYEVKEQLLLGAVSAVNALYRWREGSRLQFEVASRGNSDAIPPLQDRMLCNLGRCVAHYVPRPSVESVSVVSPLADIIAS